MAHCSVLLRVRRTQVSSCQLLGSTTLASSVFKGLAAWTAVGRAAQNTNNKAIHPWSHGLLWKAKGVMKDGQTKKKKKVGERSKFTR
jgi:hypothetical protein